MTRRPRLARIEWARLEGFRPRPAGSNARRGAHGAVVAVPIARVTLDDGSAGFGLARLTPEQATAAHGALLPEGLTLGAGAEDPWQRLELPLCDLLARRAGLPVYALAAAAVGVVPASPLKVRCYDTSLYFDDLHLGGDDAAAAHMAAEAAEGYARGHRAFKIKVGRGARHLPLEPGTRRDIAVIRAIRAAVGPRATLLLDANNGYNLNLAKRVLDETADCRVFWIEEAFHEDPELYANLRRWLADQGLSVLIADGEGDASARLLDWAREGLIDVVQYDLFDHGFRRWLSTGRRLDTWGRCTAPHHYGTCIGNFVACHLAAAVRGFLYAEWDEATTPGLDASGYELREGWVRVPDRPGFGLELDEGVFRRAVAAAGFQIG
jgi:L-alanine-DL-glutamate epimerase-like enolase superfamily enzyme